jgi:hypothetical protein
MTAFTRAVGLAAAALAVLCAATPALAAAEDPILPGAPQVVSLTPAPQITPAQAAPVIAQDPTTLAPATTAETAALPHLSLNSRVIGFVDYGNQDEQEQCLATAVFFEARGETLEGQLAVAQVILNRTKSGRYPPTICGTVLQPAQFSFVRGGRLPSVDRKDDCWHKALAIADIALKSEADALPANVLWYHASYVDPRWNRAMTRTVQIGSHIFYS